MVKTVRLRCKLLILAVLLLAAVSAIPAAAADSECTHRWVEATAEDPGFCYWCGTLDYDRMNYIFPAPNFYITVLQTMNCRKSPTLESDVACPVYPGVYTITEVQSGWGKLISGAGWIHLTNPNYISIPSGSSSGISIEPLYPTIQTQLSAKIGDTITLGHFEQDGNVYNGVEPIEWIVVDKSDDKLLVVSKYCLESAAYNDTFTGVSWETCSIRNWLNNDFLNSAFSDTEKTRLVYVMVKNAANHTYGTDSGNDTVDRLFLLSYDETVRYFRTDADRVGIPTALAKNDGAYVCAHGATWWWLRGSGEFTSYASLVGSEGNANDGGNYVNVATGGIRPAMWITAG